MSDGYSYIVEMVDRISGPAKTAQQQITGLVGKLGEEEKALKKLEAQLKGLESAEVVDIKARESMVKAIANQKSKIEGLGNTIRGAVDDQREQAKAAAEASEAASGLGETLSAIGPYAAAAAAAIALVVGAIVSLTIAGAKLALDAAKFKADTTAALSTSLQTAEQAGVTYKEIRKISDEIGVSEEKAQKLGLSLIDAGLSQQPLADAIKSIATLEKVRGEQAAGKLQELIKKSAAAGQFRLEGESLAGTGLNQADVLNELAAATGKGVAQVQAELKAGKISAEQGISAINAALTKKLGGATGLQGLEDATGKLQEKFRRLFEDVNVQPFLDLLKDIGDLFDESSVSGEALKYLATTIFDGLFATAKAAFPYIKSFILELVIAALKLYITMKPIVKTLAELWATGEQGESTTDMILLIVDLMGSLITVTAQQIGHWLIFASVMIQVWDTVIGTITSAIADISAVLSTAWDFLASLFSGEQGSSIGASLIDGLIGGILGGGPGVIASMAGIGTSAINSIKGVLGIASPSKVGDALGENFAASFGTGAENEAGDVQSSLESVVSPPAPAAPPSGGDSSAAGPSIMIAPGAIVINAGGASASEITEMLQTKMQDIFEGILMQLGGAKEADA